MLQSLHTKNIGPIHQQMLSAFGRSSNPTQAEAYEIQIAMECYLAPLDILWVQWRKLVSKKGWNL